MIGQLLANRYRVVREVGRGGMGVVYLARDLTLERDVALKVIPPSLLSPETEERLRREARVAARMDHPGIVPIYDIVPHETSLFLVMPFVNGITLRAMMGESQLRVDDVVEIAIQAAEALDYSHVQGVTHRDIKPENILIESGAPGGLRVRITDFGVAAAAFEQRVTQTGAIIGTCGYLSPEQVTEDAVDGRSDMYALGTVIYECLSGRTPFTGKAPAIFYRILFDAPKSLRTLRSDVDDALDGVVLKCLAKDPQQRFQRGKALAEALERYRARPALAPDPTPRPPVPATAQYEPIKPKLIGRDRELAMLARLLDAAKSGECQFVVVSGAPGIGKTQLLDELESLARSSGTRVLHGRFLEQDHVFPYQAFCDAFQEFFRVGGSTAGNTPVDFSDLSTDLMSLFPSLAEIDQIKSSASGVSRQTLFTASMRFDDQTAVFETLARTLTRIVDGRPLVLILEDLHAADVSAAALEYVIRRLGPTPTLVAATMRSDRINRGLPSAKLLEAFRGDRRFALLKLEPLDPESFSAFVAARMGTQRVEPKLVDRLYQFSEGNPYFARELIASLRTSGLLVSDDDGHWDLAHEETDWKEVLPDSVQTLVEERVERLSHADRELLSVAAVLGHAFDLRDLALLATDSDAVEDAVDALVDSGFLCEERGSRGDRMSFSSSLVREVLYGGLSRRKRRLLHLRFAEHLEKRTAGKLLHHLVHHFACADVPDKVITYGMKLARSALDAFAPDEAARAARTVLEFLREDHDTPGWVEGQARLLLASALRLGGHYDSALREAESALKTLESIGHDDLAGAYSLAAEIAWQSRRIDKARRWIDLGIAALEKTGEDRRKKRLLMLGATVANLRGDREGAARYLHDLERLREAEPAESTPNGGGKPPRRGALRVPVPINIAVPSLDPVETTGEVGAEICSTIFETLMRQQSGGRVVPWLVDSVRGENGARTWFFSLKSGIEFHDGRPVQSSDVKYTFERLLRSSGADFRWYFAPIRGAAGLLAGTSMSLDGFHVLNATEFSIELEQPVACFAALLTDISTAIVPASATPSGENWREGLIGTGPFRVVSFAPNRRLELEANPGYWRAGLPKSETLVFSFGVAAQDVFAGFQSGEYSIGWGLLGPDVEALRRSPEFEQGFRESPRLSTEFLAFNIHSGPFSDESLRRHILHIINPEKIARRGGHAHAVPARGLFPPGLITREAGRKSPTGPLDAASIAGPIEATLATSPLFRHEAYKSVLNEIVSALGVGAIDARIVTPGIAGTKSARTDASMDLLVDAWMADYPDPDAFAFGLLHSEHGWIGRLCGTPELDLLIERGRIETSPATRQEIYWEIEYFVARNALLLPLFHGRISRFARPEIEGFDLHFHVPHVTYEELSVVE